jgi:hypothetical protein
MKGGAGWIGQSDRGASEAKRKGRCKDLKVVHLYSAPSDHPNYSTGELS